MTTTRVARLRDEMSAWRDSVCLHRPRIVTESYQRTECDPPVVRRAKALRDVLEQMPIYLRPGDLIVGTPTSTPGAWIVLPEFSLGTESIVQMRHNFHVGEDFIRSALPDEVVDYWSTRNLHAHYAAFRRECFGDEHPPREDWYQLSTGLGHITPDFAEVLRDGLAGVAARVADRLGRVRDADPEAAEFLRAVLIALEGAMVFAHRYGTLAAGEAQREQDGRRRGELAAMAEAIPRALSHGAGGFHEALQSIWLCHQIMHIEGNLWSMSPGRVDQILWPYYSADVRAGRLSAETAVELIQCFLTKFKENTVFGPRGNPTQCITLGGSDADGSDQTNELTYLFLRAAADLKLPEPLINLRWHPDAPEELMHAAFDCVAAGLNMPVFLNDETTPRGFMALGIDAEAAYDYTHVGCGELGIPGKLQDSALGGSTGHIHALIQMLEAKRQKPAPLADQFPTFESFLDGLGALMRRNAEQSAAVSRAVGLAHERHGQIPFTSAFMHGCVERGRDLTVRAEYNFPSMNLGGGFANFVNSVAAVRDLVYQEGACNLDALHDALRTDFEGRGDLLGAARRAPKFGNDDDRVDGLVPVLEALHAEAIEGLAGPRNGGRFIASGIDGGGHLSAGRSLMATPDGRRAGRPLAPGMAAAHGTDRAGLTALLNSVRKLNGAGHWFGGYTLNIRVLPDVLASDDTRAKLIAALRTYFMEGGLNLHINSLSTETLRAAQANPEEYADLVVRVSGFSDHFVRLSAEFQAEIIARTLQMTG